MDSGECNNTITVCLLLNAAVGVAKIRRWPSWSTCLHVFLTWNVKLSQDKSYCNCVSFSIALNSMVFTTYLTLQAAALETQCKTGCHIEVQVDSLRRFCKLTVPSALYRSLYSEDS